MTLINPMKLKCIFFGHTKQEERFFPIGEMRQDGTYKAVVYPIASTCKRCKKPLPGVTSQ